MSHRDNISVNGFPQIFYQYIVPTELIDLSIYSYRYYVPNGTIILMPYLWILSYVNFQLITAIIGYLDALFPSPI
ncbi:MAG: hypothetical protein AB1414_19905 [bacterium]